MWKYKKIKENCSYEELRRKFDDFVWVSAAVDGTKLLPDEGRWFVDGIHPNEAGEDLLYQHLTKELQ